MRRSSYPVKFLPARSKSKTLDLGAYREFVVRGRVSHAENHVLAHFMVFLRDGAVAHIKTAVGRVSLSFSDKTHPGRQVNFLFQVNQLTPTDQKTKAIASCIKFNRRPQLFVDFRVGLVVGLIYWRIKTLI